MGKTIDDEIREIKESIDQSATAAAIGLGSSINSDQIETLIELKIQEAAQAEEVEVTDATQNPN